MRRHSLHSRFSLLGTTLVEAMIACGIISSFFVGMYAANWRGLYLLKNATDTASANQVLSNLAEQIRTANWSEITDPTYLSGTILTNSTAQGHLQATVQTIDVKPYPVVGVSAASIEVVRSSTGTVSTTLAGNGTLSSKPAVRVDLTLKWNTALNQTPHTRMFSLIVSPQGTEGQN